MNIIIYFLCPFLVALVGAFFGTVFGCAVVTRYIKGTKQTSVRSTINTRQNAINNFNRVGAKK